MKIEINSHFSNSFNKTIANHLIPLITFRSENMSAQLNIENQWANATIKNNFIFSKTMEMFPYLCRKLLEFILRTCVHKRLSKVWI